MTQQVSTSPSSVLIDVEQNFYIEGLISVSVFCSARFFQ